MKLSDVVVDFVVFDESKEEWGLVLVEQGPWEHQIGSELRRVQDRLYGCVEAALFGELGKRYPESVGKPIRIRLDAYDVPFDELKEFFEAFSTGVMRLPEYHAPLKEGKYCSSLSFELNIEELN